MFVVSINMNRKLTDEEFSVLYEKCTSGKASAKEQQLFEEYGDDFKLSDIPWTADMGDHETIRELLTTDLSKKIAQHTPRKFPIVRWLVAASILVIPVAVFFLAKDDAKETSGTTVKIINISDTYGNKPNLLLHDGKNISLENSFSGTLINEQNVSVKKEKNNKLVYKINDQWIKYPTQVFNTLSTPLGVQYQVVLSDGTKVWLNTGSSLKYPVAFLGKERIVQLTGEAYFEVAENKLCPFKVIANNINVRVLGTHFNVNAYPEDIDKVTLLQGAVILEASNHKAIHLRPGQEASLSKENHFDVQQIKANDAIAWKNGIFLFNNESMEDAMKKIARWYNVEVVLMEGVEKRKLGGSISRYENIADMLQKISLTGNINFKIEGRRIIVKSK